MANVTDSEFTPMFLDEAFIRFKSLVENSDKETSEILKLSLTHISAKHLIKSNLEKIGLGTDVLEKFGTLGKSVFRLFSSMIAVNIDGVDSSGKASLKANKINNNLQTKLVKIIQENNLGLFGPGEDKNKQDSNNKVWFKLALQFIGALSFKSGINKTFYLLESLPFSSSVSYSIKDKDPKTFLQEYLQKNKKALPIYERLEQTGFEHLPEFRIALKADGKFIKGIGKSVKLAEQDAALGFINRYLPFVKILHNSDTNKKREKDRSILLKIFRELPNKSIVQYLMDEFQINHELLVELSLALVHCSYDLHLKKYQINYGYNNQIISFLGSAALNWSVHDILTRKNIELDESIRNDHYISVVLSDITNNKSISETINVLNFSNGLLMGPGQINNITLEMKAEAVQALVGCLFIDRSKSITFGEDLLISKNNKLLSWALSNIEKSINKKPQNILPPKTHFQEQCQAVGIKIIYESPEIVNTKIIRVKARLLSQDNTKSHLVSLKAREYQIETRKYIESRLAGLLSKNFQIANGIENDADSTKLLKLPGHAKTADFLFTNCIIAAKRSLVAKTLDSIKRIVKMNFFGLTFLQHHEFSNFNNWLSNIDGFLQNDSVDNYLEDLIEFYLAVGRQIFNNSRFENIAITSIKGLCEYFDSLDPLASGSSIQDSDYFRKVNDSAKALRLTGSVIRIISIEEFKQEFSIIFRNQNIDILFLNSIDNLSIIEITGSHLALIQFLLNSLRDIVGNKTRFILLLDYQEDSIIINFKAENCYSQDISFSEILEKSIFWVFLKEILPIKNVKVIEDSFYIFIDSISKSKRDNFIRQAFLALNFGVSFSSGNSEVIPGILHDLKNELLAYQSAANQANKATSTSKKHFLASEAYKHLEKGKEYINIVSSILKATVNFEVNCFSVMSFFREKISELNHSLPTNIVIIPPSNVEEFNIYTDVSYLTSILINICQNAADAMIDGGKLSIEWIFDRDTLEIEIQDTGSGLTEEQLQKLNSGISISSSKKHGSGIGLLTVMMMIRKINGSIKFHKSLTGGTIVNIFVPSLILESEKKLTTEDASSISFDDNKDTIEL